MDTEYRNVTVASIPSLLYKRSSRSNDKALRRLNIGTGRDYLSADHKAVELPELGETKAFVPDRHVVRDRHFQALETLSAVIQETSARAFPSSLIRYLLEDNRTTGRWKG